MNPVGYFFLRVLFGLRVVMLVGSIGAMFGAVLMFWQGSLYLADAWNTLVGGAPETAAHEAPAAPAPADAHGRAVPAPIADAVAHGDVTQVTVQVLEAVDSFLFGVVLVIFAYSIAVGFVFRLPASLAAILPGWMKISGVGQLKQILAEVVIVVLIVIFARIIVESGGKLEWNMLVLPSSVLMLAGAIWLLELENEHTGDTPVAKHGGPPHPAANGTPADTPPTHPESHP